MQKIATYIYKIARRLLLLIKVVTNKSVTWLLFYCNNIKFGRFKTDGIPHLRIALGGDCTIGKHFKMNNGNSGNPIGRPQRCVLFVDKKAKLNIGENVGISSTAIVVYKQIVIGNNVKIGGGTCIYDSDFHSLDANLRNNKSSDSIKKINKEVIIKDNAFIGAHSTILKGVVIGENSIVGACSVVTKNIPANEIWAGNPAVLIKRIAND